MRKTKKRFLSALLACAMIISLFPFAAFAGNDGAQTANNEMGISYSFEQALRNAINEQAKSNAEITAVKNDDKLTIEACQQLSGKLDLSNKGIDEISNGAIQYTAKDSLPDNEKDQCVGTVWAVSNLARALNNVTELDLSGNTFTTVPSCFLMGSPSIEKVTLPDTVKAISTSIKTGSTVDNSDYQAKDGTIYVWGYNAFSHMKKLKTVNIPESVVYIGDYSFAESVNLEYDITNLPANLEKTGRKIFDMNESVRNSHEITYDDVKVTGDIVAYLQKNPDVAFGDFVFEGTKAYADAEELMKADQDGLLKNAYGVADITGKLIIPDGANVPNYCFDGWDITEAVVPSSATVSEYAFTNNAQLKSITITDVASDSDLSNINLPANVDVTYEPAVTDNAKENGQALQAAIDAAEDGDTIIVAPGTYDGNIMFGGKSLTIKAQYPAYENGKKQDDQSKLSKFTGTFNTFNSDYQNHENQTIVIEGFALSGDGLKIGNMNQNGVGNLQVRHCTMECGDNMTETNANNYAGWNYFVKVSDDPTDGYAKVTVEDNYIFGTPATSITPIQLWQVDDVVVKNNKIELTNASDKQGINISKMSANANVEVTDNVISGAGGGIYVTTWQLDGVTQVENPATFNGTINIENNTIEVLNSSNAEPIFIGNENNDQPYGLIGGTIHATNNVDQNGNIITPVISQKDGDTTTVQATFMNNGELYEVCIGTKDGNNSATITTPAAPTREGYTFKGWVANGERYDANANVTITADTTFTADWDAPYTGKYSYEITVADTDNGSVSVDKYATEGEKVTLTVSPDKAYKLDELTVTAGSKDVDLTDNGDGTYTFIMPSSNVKVSATFVEDKDYVEPGTSITMTIGSNDFVINNNVVTVPDAAPYIANDRTYVPFRALGEALGAKVVWDNDARTVTYTLGGTEIVMTIGDTTYTVNGEEKSMDVAPEITGDRTYVPVRFVAEGLGFKVTPLYADNGTTTSVVFEK